MADNAALQLSCDVSGLIEAQGGIAAFSRRYRNIANRVPFIMAGMARRWLPKYTQQAYATAPRSEWARVWRPKAKNGGVFGDKRRFVVYKSGEGKATFGIVSPLTSSYQSFQEGGLLQRSNRLGHIFHLFAGRKHLPQSIVPGPTSMVPQRDVIDTMALELKAKYNDLFAEAVALALKSSLRQAYKPKGKGFDPAKAQSELERLVTQRKLNVAPGQFEAWLKSKEFEYEVGGVMARNGLAGKTATAIGGLRKRWLQ